MKDAVKDGLEATLVVELAPDEVWKKLAQRELAKQHEGDETQYILPGWPSTVRDVLPGARCTLLELDPGRLLRVRKDVEPCANTEIAITLEAEDSGTRITIVQSGFPAIMLQARGFLEVWKQILAGFRRYIETGVAVPLTFPRPTSEQGA